MKKIASFTINHDVLTEGMYVSRIDGDAVTYDVRMKKPNGGDYLEDNALHTLEHLMATYMRNTAFSDNVIYVGPMGCRTGFYVILRDSVSYEDAIRLVREALVFSAAFEGEIPGSTQKECGNYLAHDLNGAKAAAADMAEVLRDWTPERLKYPEGGLSVKNILCFGDSNTFGYKPDCTGRYTYNERWTGLLAQSLGAGYRVIEEGLNGRTTVFRDDEKPFATGLDYIFPCLMSHRPLDLVIVMLGTNDCKTKFNAEPQDIADGLEQILDCIQQPFYERTPKVLILSPASIAESEDRSEFYGEFFNHYLKVSQGLAACYKVLAQKRSCYFLDINTVTQTSEIDGVHFDLSAHRQIAAAVEKKIREEIFPK